MTPNTPLTAADLTAKSNDLVRMGIAARRLNSGHPSPRQTQAIGVAIVTGFLFVLVAAVALPLAEAHLGLDVGGWPVFISFFLVSLFAGVMTYRRSDEPDSVEEELDRLLMAYEPLSTKAFLELQSRVQEHGHLHQDPVNAWIANERAAISNALIRLEPGMADYQKPRFVSRQF